LARIALLCARLLFSRPPNLSFDETSITHQKIRQSTKECTERCHMHQTLDFSLVYYWQGIVSLLIHLNDPSLTHIHTIVQIFHRSKEEVRRGTTREPISKVYILHNLSKIKIRIGRSRGTAKPTIKTISVGKRA
jgi:hypothetical protein